MLEFENGGNEYRTNKLSAMQQFHLSRKIAPVIPRLVPLFLQLAKQPNGEMNYGAMAIALEPFAEALAAMQDDHAEYVVNVCMSSVMRKVGKDYTPVMSKGQFMFDDMDLGALMPMVVKVIWDNLGNFITGLVTNNPAIQSPGA